MHKKIDIYKELYKEDSKELANAYCSMGYLHYYLHKYKGSVEAFNKYYNMEHTYIEQGRHNEAQQYKTKAKKIESI